ncbi:MAG: phosphoribosylglycinamide formyltransferase [Candidatus Marinimicrobia bacterium]|jgi:formyltetrahydrofolate-dependent phosphoribosylglycinamide formyltransferase|nr:phosphoribosylglycinamide formyltransferase [Candidatus Neomarinimicrobiota bacterium]
MIKLGVLGSTNGTDLQTILDSIASGELNGKVSVVLSNRKNAYILERAKNHNVPAFFNSHKEKSREEFDDEMTAILKEHAVDLVLLIGFMRILSSKFCQDWRDRLLNVHPSLLPKYAGGMDTNVYEDVLKNGDAETGCTIHFVTDEVDDGPILIQKKCNIEPDETVYTLKTKVQQLEGIAFIEAIQLIQNNSYVR